QAINTALIDRLLEVVKPGPIKKARLEAQLKRAQAELRSISTLVERLEKETPNLVLQSSLQGELATPLVSLLQQRAVRAQSVMDLEEALAGGLDQDAIVAAPSLPVEPSGPRKLVIAIGVALVSGVVLLVLVVLRAAARGESSFAQMVDVLKLRRWST